MSVQAPSTADGVTTEIREASPSHLLLRIESAALLFDGSYEKYESIEFMAGDYKWKLVIYPNGNKTGEREEYITVNLAVANTGSLPTNWEINVVFSIFLYNQIHDNYLCARGKVRRFHSLKAEWGFPEFISRKDLNEPSNGYLVDDNCVFGAEVFIIKSERAIERLSMLKDTEACSRTFKVSQFSKIERIWHSEEFTARDQKWKLVLHPKGTAAEVGRSASMYLQYVDSGSRKVRADFSICIKDQVNNKDHCRKLAEPHWFSPSSDWGYRAFIPLADLKDRTKGFIVNDCCIIEINIWIQAIASSSLP